MEKKENHIFSVFNSISISRDCKSHMYKTIDYTPERSAVYSWTRKYHVTHLNNSLNLGRLAIVLHIFASQQLKYK